MQLGGWYPDPDGGPDRVRWWDGRGWTEHAARRGDPETTGQPGAGPDLLDSGGGRRLRVPATLTAVVIVALVVTAVLMNNGSRAHDHPAVAGSAAPTAQRPRLAQLCSAADPDRATPKAPNQAPRPGPRITDRAAHVSYAAMGSPFRSWNLGRWGTESGGLGESFTTGQYFVTQRDTPAGSYLATILSGTVPATYSDDPHPNVECAARVIADDVRKSYYPQPNTRTDVLARATSVGGRPAYLLRFHLAFHQRGYDARGEQVGICVIDVPGSRAAAVYVSIPDTHRHYDSVISTVIDSIRLVR